MQKTTKALWMIFLALAISGCRKESTPINNNHGLGLLEEGLLILIENQSGLPDDSIFFSCMGYQGIAPDWDYCWVDSNNKMIPVKMEDNTHLFEGQYYADYSYSSAQVKSFMLQSLDAARIRFSIGKPIRMKILKNNPGAQYTQPDWNNPADPNRNIIYDKIEFTYTHGILYINTTAVDFLGIPYTLTGYLNGDSATIGMAVTRKKVFQYFIQEAPQAYQVLVQGNERVVAPDKLIQGFDPNYFDPYIDKVWNKYKTDSLIITGGNASPWRAAGIVNHQGEFVFYFTSSDTNFHHKTVTLNKPTSSNVFGCNGALQTDGSKPLPEQKLIPIIAGALNRSTLLDYNNQHPCDTSAFYKNDISNWFSKILHQCSIDNKCYGFPYDDDCDQSSLFPVGNLKQVKIIITPIE